MSIGTGIILGIFAQVVSAPLGIFLGYKLVNSKIRLAAVAVLALSGFLVSLYMLNVRMADHPNKLLILTASMTVAMLAYGMCYGHGFRTSDEKRAQERRASLEAKVDQWRRQRAADEADGKGQLVIAYDNAQLAHYHKALGQPNAALAYYARACPVYMSELGRHPLSRAFYEEYAALLREALRVEEAEKVERFAQGS